jgi:hypothetical protein
MYVVIKLALSRCGGKLYVVGLIKLVYIVFSQEDFAAQPIPNWAPEIFLK